MKTLGWLLCTVVLLGGAAFAGDATGKAGKMPEMTTEQRGKMADVHEKMAACLRSDRPVATCHDEMKTSCQDVMGANGCPMMGGMGGMKHRGRMMNQDQAK